MEQKLPEKMVRNKVGEWPSKFHAEATHLVNTMKRYPPYIIEAASRNPRYWKQVVKDIKSYYENRVPNYDEKNPLHALIAEKYDMADMTDKMSWSFFWKYERTKVPSIESMPARLQKFIDD